MQEYLIDKNGKKRKKPVKKEPKKAVYRVLYREQSGRAIIDEKVFTVWREATARKKELEKELKEQGYYNFLVVFPQVYDGNNV